MSAERSSRAAIDRAYTSLYTELPTGLVGAARRLPRRLGLASRDDVGWGEVFEDTPILGLPTLLLGEGGREVDEKLRACTQRAHVFALLAARIDAGVDAGQLELDEELDGVLRGIERERNRALAELRMLGGDRKLSFTLPEREVRTALAREREILTGEASATLADYLTLSTAKQNLAFPAIFAAGTVLDLTLEEVAAVHELILGIMLGIQIRDDVERWLEEDDKDSTWVAALSSGRCSPLELVTELLRLSRDAFERGAGAASELGVEVLRCWASSEAEAIGELERLTERRLAPALAG
jgi:hypothetical protein